MHEYVFACIFLCLQRRFPPCSLCPYHVGIWFWKSLLWQINIWSPSVPSPFCAMYALLAFVFYIWRSSCSKDAWTHLLLHLLLQPVSVERASYFRCFNKRLLSLDVITAEVVDVGLCVACFSFHVHICTVLYTCTCIYVALGISCGHIFPCPGHFPLVIIINPTSIKHQRLSSIQLSFRQRIIFMELSSINTINTFLHSRCNRPKYTPSPDYTRVKAA